MILETIFKLVLAMGVGYYLSKRNIFTRDVNQKLSYLVMNVCLPLMILTSINRVKDAGKKEILTFAAVGCCFYAVLPFVSRLLCRILRVRAEERPVYELFFIFSNITFMGYPVSASLYGNDCIFYIEVFHILFNLLFFTYGVSKLKKGKEKRSETGRADGKRSLGGKALRSFFSRENLKVVLSSGTVASLAAIVMFLSGLRLPQQAARVLDYIGSVTSPLSMIIVGATLGYYPLRKIATENKKLYLVAAIRVIAMPFAVYWIMTFLGFDGLLRGIATVTFGMPVASTVAMGCTEYGSFTALGTQGVGLTTVLSLGIIPFLLIILS